MRLLSYHIENYGKFHNQDGRFDAGLTEFCEANGHGKTTLASFLRAMFYGLPTYTARTTTFDDRQHFYPFNGGKFGGNLTFEMQGKTYKIERFFDKKSATKDEVKVYCDGALYMGFGEEIGKKVFGLDEESFKKTVFITADEVEIKSTGSINEKLNRDVEGGEDSHFEVAVEKVEKAQKALENTRKNGLIPQTKEKISKITYEIKNLKDMSEGLDVEYIELERLTKEIATAEAEVNKAGERNTLLEKWKHLDSLMAQAEEKRGVIKGFEGKYPQGVPTEKECETMRDCIGEETRLKGLLQGTSFGEDKEKRLAELTEKFQNGAPRDEDIAQKQQKINDLSSLKSDLYKLQTAQKDTRQKDLEKRFCDKLPTNEELERTEKWVEDYKVKDEQIKQLNASLLHTAPVQQRQGGKAKALCTVLAVACLIGGGVLLGIQSLTAGLVLMGIGALLFVVGMLSSSNKSQPTTQPNDVTAKIGALQGEMNALENKIGDYARSYWYPTGEGVVYAFKTLKDDVAEYKAQAVKTQESEKTIKAMQEKVASITSEVQAFLWGYGERGEDLQNGLTRILSTAGEYRSLQKDKAEAGDKILQLKAQITQCKNTLAELLKKYSLDESTGTMAGLNDLVWDCKRWKTVQEGLEADEREIAKYQTENGLTERPEDTEIDTNALHSALSTLRRQQTECSKRIEEIEREVGRLPDLESELDQANEEKNRYEEKQQLLNDTMAALKEAEKSLKDKYIAPIKDQFSKYADALEKVLDDKVTMDRDYRVTFERGGENRSDKHLSAGERTLCALCVRLALIDNMYKTEQPFIIMDDPFVHLDEAHIERTAKLLQTLAEERQILYFCCHESRSMQNKM